MGEGRVARSVSAVGSGGGCEEAVVAPSPLVGTHVRASGVVVPRPASLVSSPVSEVVTTCLETGSRRGEGGLCGMAPPLGPRAGSRGGCPLFFVERAGLDAVGAEEAALGFPSGPA